MSTFPSPARSLAEGDPVEVAARDRPPFAAAAYGATIAAAALAVAIPLLYGIDGRTEGWLDFALIATGAAVAQLFVVHQGPRTHQSYHAHGVFLIPAILLLPPELLVLVAIVQHVPEWLKERYPWYIQSFNICNYTLTSLGGDQAGTRNVSMRSCANSVSSTNIPSRTRSWSHFRASGG